MGRQRIRVWIRDGRDGATTPCWGSKGRTGGDWNGGAATNTYATGGKPSAVVSDLNLPVLVACRWVARRGGEGGILPCRRFCRHIIRDSSWDASPHISCTYNPCHSIPNAAGRATTCKDVVRRSTTAFTAPCLHRVGLPKCRGSGGRSRHPSPHTCRRILEYSTHPWGENKGAQESPQKGLLPPGLG